MDCVSLVISNLIERRSVNEQAKERFEKDSFQISRYKRDIRNAPNIFVEALQLDDVYDVKITKREALRQDMINKFVNGYLSYMIWDNGDVYIGSASR